MHPTQLQMHRLISPYAKASYRVDRIGQSASRTNLHGYTQWESRGLEIKISAFPLLRNVRASLQLNLRSSLR